MICTALTIDFIPGYQALITSIRTHTTSFNEPVSIIDIDGIDRRAVEAIYPNCSFIDPIKTNYLDLSAHRPALRNAFCKLEAFRIASNQRLLFIDSDIIFIESIRPLLELQTNADVSLAYHAKWDAWNTGVMVIEAKAKYQDLIELMRAMDSAEFADQSVIERAIKQNVIKVAPLDNRWNATKRQIKDGLTDYASIHFVSKSKPWIGNDPGFADLEKVWWRYVSAATFKRSSLDSSVITTP